MQTLIINMTSAYHTPQRYKAVQVKWLVVPTDRRNLGNLKLPAQLDIVSVIGTDRLLLIALYDHVVARDCRMSLLTYLLGGDERATRHITQRVAKSFCVLATRHVHRVVTVFHLLQQRDAVRVHVKWIFACN